MPSQTSTQVWLPSLCGQRTETSRAGTQHARQASASRIDSPVHVAFCCAIDSLGDARARLRPVE
ncbi:MAG: hypothetical protein U1E73_08995 [Planctomycetota bacterium]